MRRRFQLLIGCTLLSVAAGCSREQPRAREISSAAATPATSSTPATAPTTTNTQPAEIAMKLTTTAFHANGAIPTKYTCEGDDVSPPLALEGVPANAKSLVLIVEDPDAPDPAAPKRIWVHWIVYNLPPTSKAIPEGASALPDGARLGANDWGNAKYNGPCPPVGRHRYFHRLFALDIVLPDLGKPKKAAIEKAMAGHILASTELVGTYEKQRK